MHSALVDDLDRYPTRKGVAAAGVLPECAGLNCIAQIVILEFWQRGNSTAFAVQVSSLRA